jgi:hypothetical protein
MIFRTLTSLLYSCADRFEQCAKPELLTPKPIQFQETCNLSIVDNFLIFPTHPYATYLVKRNKSYRNRKTARKHRFQQEAGNGLGVETRWELAPELSYNNNLVGSEVCLMIFSNWVEFQSGTLFSSVLPFWIESVLDKRSTLNSMLTSNSTHFGEACYTKIVDNFDTFLASIYKSSSGIWFRINDLWNSGDAAGNDSCWTDLAELIHLGVWAFIPEETDEAQNTTT